MKKLGLAVASLFVGCALIFAQDKVEKLPYNRWEIGINSGVANFAGSTVIFGPSFGEHFSYFKSDLNFGYGAFIRKNFTQVFALEGSYNGTTLTGNPKSGIRVKAFTTGINEFDLNTVWNINNLFSKHKFDRKIYWFAKVGIGLTLVKVIDFTQYKSIMDPWRGTLSAGTGLAFRLRDNIKLDIGTQISTVNTNELDGLISSERPDSDSPGYLSAQIREHCLYTYVGLTFSLGKKN